MSKMISERVLAVKKNFHDLLIEIIKEMFYRHFPKDKARLMFEYIILETLIQKDNEEIIIKALKKILGTNFIPLSLIILRRLYNRLNFEFDEKENYEVIDYLHDLREKFEEI